MEAETQIKAAVKTKAEVKVDVEVLEKKKDLDSFKFLLAHLIL